jgi:RND family efflux transporter MFP subunit
MSVRTKVYGLVAVLLLASTGMWIWKAKPSWVPGVSAANAAQKQGENKKNEKEATAVELVTARSGEISSYVSATANLRALRDVAVASQTEGIVQEVLVEEGDFLKEGQLLARFDDTQHQIRLKLATERLEQAKLQMDKARVRQEKATAQLGHTRTELTRYERALKEGLVSDKEVATYRYRLEELLHDQKVSASENREFQHKVAELEAEIAQSKLEISRTRITAPFDGYITLRSVNIGQRVRPMEAMYNIGAFSPLFADVHLSERDTRLVKSGQPAAIHLGSDDAAVVHGKVERLSPVVDQASGTVKVTVALQPAPGFRPGAFVRVEIRTDTRTDATLIPKRAVIDEDGQHYVFTAHGDSVKRVKVQLGYSSEGVVQIDSGVQPGEKVVVAGQGALKDGAKVRVVKG